VVVGIFFSFGFVIEVVCFVLWSNWICFVLYVYIYIYIYFKMLMLQVFTGLHYK
jgi:hypothetical protein